MHQHSTHRRWILSFVIILALTLATPVLANYVGPNRTVTETNTTCKAVLNECRYVEEKAEWKYKTTNTWSCSLESKPWETYSSDSRPCNDTTHTPGYEYWSKEDVTTTQTVTYPPATITGALENCTSRNGWCITVPQLSMQGIEPVAGYRIFSIEGSLNGQNFACMSPRCTVQLKQGQNDFAFWALSTFVTLDSSEMDTFSAKVDSKPPTITSSMTGSQGSNGWYLGPITFNSSAADATSGLVKLTCDLDGTVLSDCDMFRIKGDGPHLLHLLARDYALHIHEITLTPSIDSQNPTLSAFIDGTLGSNTWYTAATLNASAADASPGSGLSTFEYNLEGSGWTAFPASGTLNLADGQHIVDLRAVDNAGRSVSSSASFWLDTRAPNVSLDSAGTFGSNDWYITSPTLTAFASDDTSGLDSFEYSLDNGAWTAYTIPLSLDDGVHSVSIWAQDQAGLVTQVERTYQVDTRAPQIAGSLSGTPGANGWFTSQVAVSASASDPLPGSALDAFNYTLNGSVETPYVDPIVLADGAHIIQLFAHDKAGLSHSIEQTLKVDTIPPFATIDTAIPNWVKGTLNLSGTANDNGSGLSSVELSFDEGQTWQAATGTDSWNAAWNTVDGANGIHEVGLRAIDQAGLSTDRIVYIGVDNQSPDISLPDSWLQWDTVTLDISDEHIGLSEARVEISDPQGRWPTRVIALDPGQFPLAFKWDRRFADDTLAEAGIYDVKVFASDSLGNTADKTASIRVWVDILPPGPTSTQANTQTPVVTVVNTATSIVPRTSTPVSTGTTSASPTIPVNTATKVILVFGTIEPPAQATSTPVSTPAPRTTPTQATAVSWLQSIFAPENTEESTTQVEAAQEPETQPAPTESSVLWGTGATAAIAAVTMYIQEERRKRAEELARLKALEEAQEERRKKMQGKKTEKMEAQRAQEAVWEAAREAASAPVSIDIKIARAEEEEALNNLRAASPAANSAPPKLSGQEKRTERKEELIQEEENSYTAKPQEWKTAYENYMAQHALLTQAKEKEKEEEASAQPQKKSWWEQAKSFVSENVIQPINTYVYKPLVKPAVEQIVVTTTNAISWVDKNVYQPYIQPAVENTMQFIASESAWVNEQIVKPYVQPAIKKVTEVATSGINWINEQVYQPYIKPAVETATQNIVKSVELLNEKVYEPYIQPAITVFNETVFQPYVKPVVEEIKGVITETTTWVNETIYQPYIEPVVDDINQYIYQPLTNEASNWWNEYGDWVHGGLDAVGFIPGVGEIADGLNGLIYLGEGRYLEAGLAAMAMIPLIGDLGKAGKWTINVAEEVIEKVAKEVAEEAVEKAAKELLEESTEKVVEEVTEELVEKSVNEVSEELAEKITKETLEESAEKIVKEVSEELAEEVSEKALKETNENLIKESTQVITDKTTKEVISETPAVPKNTIVEEAIEETPQNIDQSRLIDSLKEQYGEEVLEIVQKYNEQGISLLQQYGNETIDFVNRAEKFGINPTEILENPPLPGQSLEGWLLGIESPNNPVNQPLVDLNLTESDLNNILSESIKRPDSKVVVLGYGNGSAKPYYNLSEEIEGCHLSISEDTWKPFGNAKANFWKDINAPFLEKAINERKIFLFNVNEDTIIDPKNIERFSLPELRLIEVQGNNYVKVSIKDYTAYIPAEQLDTYEDYLPSSLRD